MKSIKQFAIGLASCAAAVSFAQPSFEQVAADAERDLREAERELANLREQIANEKIPISKQLTALESEVQTLRKDYDQQVRIAENKEVDINSLRETVKKRNDEIIFLKNLMSSYVAAFSTRVHESEMQKLNPIINEAQSIMERPTASDEERFESQLEVIKASLDRIEDIVGGTRFEGSALGQNEREVRGQFVLVGPFAFFGDGGENVGFATGEVNAAFPIVMKRGVSPEVIQAIADLTADGEGMMPIDPTEGNAIKLAITRETFVEHIRKGGVTMIPILGIAFVALVIAIFKFFEIVSVKRPRAGSLQEIIDALNSGNKQQALEVANSVDGPFGDLLVAGVEHADQEKELLEEVLYERLLAAQPKLERFIAFIALTAAAAPLLGLLGTVTGMINTFKLITVFGTGDAKSLSSGISEALITTEFGLYVAIPSLLTQALLTRLAKGKLGEMEQASVAFVNGLNKTD